MRFFTSFYISSSFQQLSRKIVNNAKNRNWRNYYATYFSPVKPIASVVFQPWLHFHFLHFNFLIKLKTFFLFQIHLIPIRSLLFHMIQNCYISVSLRAVLTYIHLIYQQFICYFFCWDINNLITITTQCKNNWLFMALCCVVPSINVNVVSLAFDCQGRTRVLHWKTKVSHMQFFYDCMRSFNMEIKLTFLLHYFFATS